MEQTSCDEDAHKEAGHAGFYVSGQKYIGNYGTAF